MAGKATQGRLILPETTAAQLKASNPILKVRQLHYECDTGKAKVGDGVTHWNNLPYVGGTDGKAATVKVGTVTTLQPWQPATVNNSGTENAAVLNFGIPKGQTGSGGGSADPNIGKGQIWILDAECNILTSPSQTNLSEVGISIDPLENAFDASRSDSTFMVTAKIDGVFLVVWEADIEYYANAGNNGMMLDYKKSTGEMATLNCDVSSLSVSDLDGRKAVARTCTVRMNQGDSLCFSQLCTDYLAIEIKFSITKIA